MREALAEARYKFADKRDGVAAVRLICTCEDITVLVCRYRFDGRRACVYSDICCAPVFGILGYRDCGACMALAKLAIILFALEERRA